MHSLALVAFAILVAQDPKPVRDPAQRDGGVRIEEINAIPRSKAKHGGGGRLVLPARSGATAGDLEGEPREQDASRGARQQGADDELRRVGLELRRSLHLPESKQAAILERVGRTLEDVPARSLALLRTADADLGYGLLLLLQRFAGPEHAADLEYLLLTRSLGSSTDFAIDTLAMIAQDAARERLFSCLVGSLPQVRFHAARALATRVRDDDAERLLALSRDGKGDVRAKALRLLGGLSPSPELRGRLIEALAEDAVLAESAMDALIAQGVEPVADLQDLLSRPARGRAFGHAAIVLATLQAANPATVLFRESMREPLLAELDMPDTFQRAAVSLALVELASRSDDVTGARYRDRDAIDALVAIAAPTEFVPHLARLKGPALAALARFAGRDFGSSTALWREWWGEAGKTLVVGARRNVPVDGTNAALAALVWRRGDQTIVLRGENAPVPVGIGEGETYDFFLPADELLALVSAVQGAGFASNERGELRVNESRSLAVQVGAAVSRTDPQLPSHVLDRLAARVEAVAHAQRWQLWRDPVREPDAAAFWRAELRWRAQHADAAERVARERRRLLEALGRERGRRRELAFEELASFADLRASLTAADGELLLAAAGAVEPWDACSFRLVELALFVEDDVTWRASVETARARDERERDGDPVLPRVFALLGQERLIECLGLASPAVRLAAMEELGRAKDLRAAPALLKIALGAEEPIELRQAAVQAIGAMRAFEARTALLTLLDTAPLAPALRRATWIALGNLGGEGVFDALRQAMATPDEADRLALVRALGALRVPEAAFALAELVAIRKDDMLGSMALEMLRQQGDHLASPALRSHLQDTDPLVRGLVALALAEFQDPAALPELFAMLEADGGRLRIVAAIAAITGRDATSENARLESLRQWWAVNRDRPQARWFLDALAQAELSHTLTAEQLAPESGVAAVAELTRLILELQQPHLRALAGRMLRVTTGVDHGTILPLMPEAQRLAICERYRLLLGTPRAVVGR
ncbi:MAG: HEAT repeat domain-containing protein [Planctomycetes bacterium]|nr:HEAT repeat domain-containing protein [Planctomycetota bacterium]